jgi:hypothetical protein
VQVQRFGAHGVSIVHMRADCSSHRVDLCHRKTGTLQNRVDDPCADIGVIGFGVLPRHERCDVMQVRGGKQHVVVEHDVISCR